jgi:5-methylcytosine-specific restriction endonuclease McrBC GTP-binding regulatory subunit McrB
VTLSDGSIRNTYDVRLRNKHGEDRGFVVTVAPSDVFELKLEGYDENVTDVPADSTKLQRVYIVAAPDTDAAQAERTEMTITVTDPVAEEQVSKDTVFNGRDN